MILTKLVSAPNGHH